MPNIDGTDFIKMIRDINQEVPIVILSAYINNEALQQCINYGIQGYIHKPISEEILQNQINNIKKIKKEKSLISEYHDITDASAIITKTNRDGIITYVNETYCKVSGFSKEELIGQKHSLIKSQKESPQFFKSIWDKIAHRKKVWTGILKHQTKLGELYYLKTTIQPIINANKEIEHFITLSIPVTDIIHQEKQLSDYLKQHKKSILLLVKIEEFKYLKHSFTHKITKRLQELFAKELLKHMPIECNFNTTYILNNGKFIFIKEDSNFIDKEKMSEILKVFQQKVNREKIKIGIVDYTLSIVCSLAYGENALENAKIGLNKILKNKEDFIVATGFLEKAIKESNEKLNKFNMLKEAIDSYKIISHFQPIINNKTLEIEKYESLVRLIDKNGNIVSPYHFLDIAKEGKYYHEITSIVLKNSFRALFNSNINISLNLSALDMEDEKTKSEFFSLLAKYKTETHRVTIEIVEDERIHNMKSVQAFILAIKKQGVKIALDDFGKGLSNFTRVHYYQPDYIKIDGSLIKNIEHDEFSKNLVETIVFFAKKQNIETVAEFVENEKIYNILKDLGVDYSQGHYFAKAGLLEEFIASPVL
ncbi:MAG TPA: EAL domain-containing protein [Campylobacterales bacterium]|nr:EAL domain-containing protein [Campylobacterales bacterium]